MCSLLYRFAVLCGLCLILPSKCVKIRDYNRVNFEDFETFEQFAAKLLDSSNNTNTNVFLGGATPECMDRLQSPAFRGAQRHAGGDIVAVASLPASEFPFSLESCAEAFYYKVGTPILEPTSATGTSHSPVFFATYIRRIYSP